MTEKKQGYTKPDYSLRCQHCSIGVDDGGQNIGGLIARQRVTCQIGPGYSVHVATIGRCINDGHWLPTGEKSDPCHAIHSCEMELDGRKLNITEDGVLNCCKNSQGNHFYLGELKDGHIDMIDTPAMPTPPPPPQTPDYNPDKFTQSPEVEDVPF